MVEEGETKLISLLEEEHGFDVLGVPFRQVFEFGGSLHCSTWDVRRRGGKKNYFPNRENLEVDVGLEAVKERSFGKNIDHEVPYYTSRSGTATEATAPKAH